MMIVFLFFTKHKYWRLGERLTVQQKGDMGEFKTMVILEALLRLECNPREL